MPFVAMELKLLAYLGIYDLRDIRRSAMRLKLKIHDLFLRHREY